MTFFAQLSVNSNKREWKQVYLSGKPSKGEAIFKLTGEQIKRIHKSLLWIISFELSVALEGHSYTLGVLNIDGLREPLTADEMAAIHNILRPEVEGFAKRFEGMAMSVIDVRVRDY